MRDSRGPTQRDIARRLGLDVSTVNKILRNAPGPAFNPGTVRKVQEAAEALGYDRERLRHQHRRDDVRRLGRLKVAIVLYTRDGRIVDEGKAMLVEISRTGARLDQVRIPSESVPLGRFDLGIRLQPDSPEELRGRLSRAFESRKSVSIAVVFRIPLPVAWLNSLRAFRPEA